jgi:tetratricopeptide (TPR) repeat protein
VAYTDGKGNFSFQWGQNNGMMLDASQSTFGDAAFGQQMRTNSGMGQSAASMAGCELRAELAGYRSDMVNLFNRQAMDNPDVGRIVLHRLGNVEGLAISATSLMAPKDAKKAYQKGLQLMLKSKPEDALKEFEKAVTLYPKYADAWVNIGKIRVDQKNPEAAREALMKAMAADDKLVAPHIELGMIAARESKWAEAAPLLEKGLRLDPVDFPNVWYASAAANFNLKKFDEAEKSAREAIKLDPRHANPRSEYLLGLILAEKHDYAAAATQFKTYLKVSPNAPDTAVVKDQIGQIEKFLSDNVEAAKQ